jgi:hypothetical protein
MSGVGRLQPVGRKGFGWLLCTLIQSLFRVSGLNSGFFGISRWSNHPKMRTLIRQESDIRNIGLDLMV